MFVSKNLVALMELLTSQGLPSQAQSLLKPRQRRIAVGDRRLGPDGPVESCHHQLLECRPVVDSGDLRPMQKIFRQINRGLHKPYLRAYGSTIKQSDRS